MRAPATVVLIVLALAGCGAEEGLGRLTPLQASALLDRIERVREDAARGDRRAADGGLRAVRAEIDRLAARGDLDRPAARRLRRAVARAQRTLAAGGGGARTATTPTTTTAPAPAGEGDDEDAPASAPAPAPARAEDEGDDDEPSGGNGSKAKEGKGKGRGRGPKEGGR